MDFAVGSDAARRSARRRQASRRAHDRRVDGDHAEIGAHLLDLWGLPHSLVEAVAFHHRPSAAPCPAFDAVAAIHIADALVTGAESGIPAEQTLEPGYLAALEAEDRLPEWRRHVGLELVAA
jgi:HD-like signal output (HDOD) protein